MKATSKILAAVGLAMAGLLLWTARLSTPIQDTRPEGRSEARSFARDVPVALEPVGHARHPTEVAAVPSSPRSLEQERLLVRLLVTSDEGEVRATGVSVHAGVLGTSGDLTRVGPSSGAPSADDPVRIARARFPSQATNADGLVELWVEEGRSVLAAASIPGPPGRPGLEAWIQLGAKHVRDARGRAFPLRLRERQEWTVRAVDRAGRARAGVPVLAQWVESSELSELSAGELPRALPAWIDGRAPVTRALGTTDARGVLTYVREPLLEVTDEESTAERAVLLAAVVPGVEQVPVLLRAPPGPGDVIDLRVGASVEADARLLDHRGALLPGTHAVRVLEVADEGPPRELVRTLARGGQAVLGSLPPGVRLRLECGGSDGMGADFVTPFDGAGTVRAELRAGAEHAVLRGRLLDEQGQGVVHRAIEVFGAGWAARCEETDGAGDFSVLVPLVHARDAEQLLIIAAGHGAAHHLRPGAGRGDRLEYRARLGPLLQAATHDLGALEPAGDPPLLLAGRVVSRGSVDFALRVETRGPDARWTELHGVQVARAGHGEFTLHGAPAPEAPHRLLVEPEGDAHASPEPVPFEPGISGLRIELDPASTLEVPVATPLTVGSSRPLAAVLDIVLEALDHPPGHETVEARVPDGFGDVGRGGLATLRWSGLRRGAYRLRVLARGTDVVLTEVPRIVIAGPRTSSAGVLDLNGVLQRFRIRVAAPDGTPLSGARCELRWAPGAERPGVTLRGARGAGIAPASAVELLTGADGYHTDRRTLLPGTQEIVLQPVQLVATQVHVAGLDLPPGVRARLIWGPAELVRDVGQASGFAEGPRRRRATDEGRIGASDIDPGGWLELEHPAQRGAGDGLRLMLALHAPPIPGRPEVPTKRLLDDLPGWTIDSPPGGELQLVVSASLLRGALAELGRAE